MAGFNEKGLACLTLAGVTQAHILTMPQSGKGEGMSIIAERKQDSKGKQISRNGGQTRPATEAPARKVRRPRRLARIAMADLPSGLEAPHIAQGSGWRLFGYDGGISFDMGWMPETVGLMCNCTALELYAVPDGNPGDNDEYLEVRFVDTDVRVTASICQMLPGRGGAMELKCRNVEEKRRHLQTQTLRVHLPQDVWTGILDVFASRFPEVQADVDAWAKVQAERCPSLCGEGAAARAKAQSDGNPWHQLQREVADLIRRIEATAEEHDPDGQDGSVKDLCDQCYELFGHLTALSSGFILGNAGRGQQ